jgi:hypothetical protein
VTPGHVLPARELLGEMLLELNQPALALKEFEAWHKVEPNRFRGLYEAKQPGKVHRIGLLIAASDVIAPFTDAFRQGMRELGYVEGKTISSKSAGVGRNPTA